MKHYLLYALISFLGFSVQTINAQAPTVELTTESGATTICRGTEIQINLAITPDRPDGDPGRQYSVNWRRDVGDPTFIKNCQFPQPDGTCSFIRDIPQVTTTYTVEVNGSSSGLVTQTLTIIVEDVPNPGLDTTIFLCGKTGTINLLDELDGEPDMGGTWSNDTGTYDTTNPDGGVFTYTIAGSGPCPTQSATITVRPCGVNDTDGDGVTNDIDQDKDNDGIPNGIEDAFCSGGGGSTTPIFVLEEDFGFGGPARSRYVNPNLEYNSGLPQDIGDIDGEYNVATSTYFVNTNNGTFMATNLSGNVDANGDTDGRYLAINMKTERFIDEAVFVVDDLPVTPGLSYDFSMSFASLNDNPSEVPAHLSIQVVDQNTNTVIFEEDRGEIPDASIDQWQLVNSSFVPSASTNLVSIRVINKQTTGGNGNDIGIDNVFLSTNACDFDRDGIPNSEDLDSDNDGIYDIVEAGNAAADGDSDGRFDGGINATGSSTTITYTPINTDGDGTNDNFLDIDSDNDGIVDNIEAQPTATYIAPSGVDGNFNGVDDAYDTNGIPLVPENTDTTTDPDYINLNSDPEGGDCLEDTIEAYDTDQDGIAERTISGSDADNDGLDDAFDLIVLGRLTGNTNADNTNVPTDFPNNHNPSTPELDWREEFAEINEVADPIESCSTTTTEFDLFDSLEDAQIEGGIWTVPAGGNPLGNGFRGTFTPGMNAIGTYTYRLPDIATCPARVATIDVNIGTPGNAGENGAVTACNNDPDTIDLFDALLGGPDTGGSWFFDDPVDGLVSFGDNDRGTFDPMVNAEGTYFYIVGTGGCQDEAEVEVTIEDGANPGENNTINICDSDGVINLFDQLEGNPDRGGNWSGPGPAGNITNGDMGTINPAIAEPGDYTYTVFSTLCPDPVSARVRVEIEATPVVTIDNLQCSTDRSTYTIAFTTNGSWNYFLTPNVGTVDTDANMITGIPENTNVEIQAINPNNPDCDTFLTVTAPDCSCPNIEVPVDTTADDQRATCFGEPNKTLSVTVGDGLIANWYDEDDELVAINSITFTPTVDQPGVYSFFAEAEDPGLNCTSERILIEYEVFVIPQVELEVFGTLCIDGNGLPFETDQSELPEIFSGLSENEYTFQWNFEGTPIAGATAPNLTEITQPGTYSLTYTDRTTGCFSSSEAIINSVRAIVGGDLSLELSRGQFANQNDIIANMPFDGNFEFSLDGGPLQSSNVFRNVPLGLREVTVFEVNGCGEDSFAIKVFGFPAFFTPNGDGTNDLWNVKIQGDEEIPNMEIFIFDRYGKLMRRQEPTDLGWDGNFNGRPLPSTDYWYTARLLDGSGIEYTGHFNLRR